MRSGNFDKMYSCMYNIYSQSNEAQYCESCYSFNIYINSITYLESPQLSNCDARRLKLGRFQSLQFNGRHYLVYLTEHQHHTSYRRLLSIRIDNGRQSIPQCSSAIAIYDAAGFNAKPNALSHSTHIEHNHCAVIVTFPRMHIQNRHATVFLLLQVRRITISLRLG